MALRGWQDSPSFQLTSLYGEAFGRHLTPGYRTVIQRAPWRITGERPLREFCERVDHRGHESASRVDDHGVGMRW